MPRAYWQYASRIVHSCSRHHQDAKMWFVTHGHTIVVHYACYKVK